MKKQILYIGLLCCLISCYTQAKNDRLTFIVNAGMFDRLDCVVSVGLPGSDWDEAEVLFYEQSDKKKVQTPCQIVETNGNQKTIYWVLEGKMAAGSTRTFVLEKTGKKTSQELLMKVEDTGKALILTKSGKEVLKYNYGFTNPPEGVDKIYGRSGYIHPAYSPSGNILTTIQPKDHYHHYGIWNPWTRIEYDGKLYDLWNLGDKQGTVKAEEVQKTYQGSIFSGYDAGLGHYIFTPSGEQNIMDEQWKVKIWNVGGGFLWDFESHLHPSTGLPVLIKEYRYAGLGYRAVEDWTRDNSEMLTSEGKTRQQIDGSTARWIYAAGQTPTGRSGLLFLDHPDNYNAPQPLRIWDENANGKRGDVFINFAPTKNMDWELKPGGHYVLRYRILAFEEGITPEQADRLWNDFAYPPVVEIVK